MPNTDLTDNPQIIKAALEITGKISNHIDWLTNLCQVAGLGNEAHKLIEARSALNEVSSALTERQNDLQP